jgi:hypothetical protein
MMRRLLLICLLLFTVALAAAASVRNVPRRTPARHLSGKHHRRHARFRRIRFYGPPVAPELRGSRDSLLKQNDEINRAGLERIADDEQLRQLESTGALVQLTESKYLRINPSLHESRRYCRPWTAQFVDDLGHNFYQEFHKPIQVNSAVRTVSQQRHLMRVNHNAAPAEGELASSHLAGTTVDIAKRGLTRKEHKWIADYLATMKENEVIEPEEERRQACFHVMVLNSYPAAPMSAKAAAAITAPIFSTPVAVPQLAAQEIVTPPQQ